METKYVESVSRELGENFLETTPDLLEEYGTDWTRVLPVAPGALVRPRTTEQLSRFLALCSAHQVAVVPSGGRTGLSGGAVASQGEVVINLEKLNHLGEVDRAGATVQVGAGAITALVRAHCEKDGLTWPIHFSADGSSQIGGNIATNAGGMHVVRYGSTRNWVLGLEVVLMSGQRLKLGGAMEKNNSGPDLRHLLIGSEGTLGIITQATLKLCSPPQSSTLFFFGVKDMHSALSLMETLRLQSPAPLLAFEVMAQNCVELVEKNLGVPMPLKHGGTFSVLVEMESRGEGWESWVGDLLAHPGVLDGLWAKNAQEAALFWKVRDGIGEALAREGQLHKNDVCVPLSQLAAFVRSMKETESFSGDEAFVFGHLGDGNLHINRVRPVGESDKKFRDRCLERDHALFALVQECGGSISAEHGIGRLKKPFLHYTRSEEEMQLVRAIKKVFDPQGLLNPGSL